MPYLNALNLKEVKIKAVDNHKEDVIPGGALADKQTLTSIVLPDILKGIEQGGFSGCLNLSGSLIIPEGVEYIGHGAFQECKNMNGTLTLPSTLKRIGGDNEEDGRGAFWHCGFVGELKLPNELECIGSAAFNGCTGLYGELKLPENLKYLGAERPLGNTSRRNKYSSWLFLWMLAWRNSDPS